MTLEEAKQILNVANIEDIEAIQVTHFIQKKHLFVLKCNARIIPFESKSAFIEFQIKCSTNFTLCHKVRLGQVKVL